VDHHARLVKIDPLDERPGERLLFHKGTAIEKIPQARRILVYLFKAQFTLSLMIRGIQQIVLLLLQVLLLDPQFFDSRRQVIEDPQVLARYAVGRLKKKHAELVEALTGVVGEHQRAMLKSQLRVVAFLDEEISRMDAEIAERMRPSEEAVQRIDGIPGMGRRTAEEVLAEIGGDVSMFPTAAQLASWAKLCPGNNESAGKRKATTTGHGNPWLRDSLVEAAWAAAHTRDTYLSAQYHRLASRRGSKRAVMAVAHTILVIVYWLLRNGVEYRELGGNYFDERNRAATVRRAVRRIESLGYQVELRPA
jgi:transposase